MQQNIPTQDSYVYKNVIAGTNSDSNILATVEKADRVDFWRRIALHLPGFKQSKIDSRVPVYYDDVRQELTSGEKLHLCILNFLKLHSPFFNIFAMVKNLRDITVVSFQK